MFFLFYKLQPHVKLVLTKKVKLNSLKRHFLLTSIEKIDYVFLVEDYNYLFPFSHLGSNTFLEPYFSTNSLSIDDGSFGKSYGISDNIEKFSTAYFCKTIKITIKDLQLYTYKKEEPFQKISNDIFSAVRGYFTGIWGKYYLKVIRIDSYCWKMIALFLKQESTKVSLSGNFLINYLLFLLCYNLLTLITYSFFWRMSHPTLVISC